MSKAIILEYEIKTTTKRCKCELYLDGKLIGLVKSAAYDGARLLLSMGYDPDTMMTTKSVQSDCLSWKQQPLWKWAKLRSVETDTRSVRSRSFREWARLDPTAALETFRLPPYLNDKEGEKQPPVGRL